MTKSPWTDGIVAGRLPRGGGDLRMTALVKGRDAADDMHAPETGAATAGG